MKKSGEKKGFIIVFTLVLMSVLLSTALGFSYVIIADINKARAIDDSVIAYYSADTGLEQSLYLIRKMELTHSVDSLKTTNGSGILSSSNGKWNINDSTDYETNVLRQRLYNGQSVKFFILNRNNQAKLNNAKSISVQWYRGSSEAAPKLQVKMTQLTPQINGDNNYIYFTDTSEVEVSDYDNNGNVVTCYPLKNISIDQGNTIPIASDYLVELSVLGTSDADFMDRILVNAYNNASCDSNTENPADGLNPEGITNLTLKSTGQFGKSTQSIIAHILPRDPLSGLLGFVLFSEQDVVKE